MPRVTVSVEVLTSVTPEIVTAFERLVPQLSRSAPPPDASTLARIVDSPAITLLIARNGAQIAGTLTLAVKVLV